MNRRELAEVQSRLASLTQQAQVITAALDVRDERRRLLAEVKRSALDVQARVATFERRGSRRVGASLRPS